MGYAFTGLSPFDRIGSEVDQKATSLNDHSVQIVTASEIEQLHQTGTLQCLVSTDGIRVSIA
jgi:hypothetical protein